MYALQQTLLVCLLACISDQAKIGVLTFPLSNSQILFSIRIGEVLADAGHDVVLVRPEVHPDSGKINSKNAKIRQIHAPGAPYEYFKNFTDIEHEEIFHGLPMNKIMEFGDAYLNLVSKTCEAMVNDDKLVEQIEKEKFDLVIVHHIDLCQLGMVHALGIRKWILAQPGPAHSRILNELGIPTFPAIQPGLLSNHTNHMTLYQRVKNIAYTFFAEHFATRRTDPRETEILRKRFGDKTPILHEIRKTAALAFVQSDPILEYPFPYTQKIQFIAGLGRKKVQPLNEPFKSFAEKAKQLVVVSFGSVAKASEMPEKWRNAFLELFRNNPDISFVWKYEDEISVPSNVLATKWLPQTDLLAHPKTKGFVTHGGYNSLGETVSAGVPCVMVPLFADQFRNGLLAQEKGLGLQISKYDFNTELLQNRVQSILTYPKYRKTAQMYKKISQSKPITPEETITYWTNFVLEYDVDLGTPQLNIIQLYSIDVFLVFFAIILFVAYIIKRILFCYYWSCCLMSYGDKLKVE